MLPNSRRCINFDFDGTLVDSINFMKDCYYKFLKSYHIDKNLIDFETLNGPSLSEIILLIKNVANLSDSIDKLQASYMSIINKGYQDLLPAPDVEIVLEKSYENNYMINIVTSSSKCLVENWLKKNKLEQYITHIVHGGLPIPGKPDPAPYLQAIFLSGCEPQSSIAVEDSYLGSLSSLRAGLRTYCIKGGSWSLLKDERNLITLNWIDGLRDLLHIL